MSNQSLKDSAALLKRLRNAYQCRKDCGATYGVYSVGCSSSRISNCDVCDAKTWVTETRDYAYLITGIRRVEAARKSAGRKGQPMRPRIRPRRSDPPGDPCLLLDYELLHRCGRHSTLED